MSMESVIDRVRSLEPRHVVLTGGEPMIQKDVVPLTGRLKQAGYHLTIETAGTMFRDLDCDLISISPKMSNSTPSIDQAGGWRERHEASRLRTDVIQRLIDTYPYQLKFVVMEPRDVDELRALCGQLRDVEPRRILLMPEGIDVSTLARREAWLRAVCQEFSFTYCPRMHIHWYGNRRGT